MPMRPQLTTAIDEPRERALRLHHPPQANANWRDKKHDDSFGPLPGQRTALGWSRRSATSADAAKVTLRITCDAERLPSPVRLEIGTFLQEFLNGGPWTGIGAIGNAVVKIAVFNDEVVAWPQKIGVRAQDAKRVLVSVRAVFNDEDLVVLSDVRTHPLD